MRLQRCGRALFLVLALVANLIATGVPLLHALAHEHAQLESPAHGHEHEHHHHHAPSGQGDDHDEIHPDSFHDECLVVPRAELDVGAVLVPESSLEPITLNVDVAPFRAMTSLHSRAPPRASPARAPPLV